MSLNLDLNEVDVVRGDLVAGVRDCRCSTGTRPRRCTDCQCRQAVIGELERILDRAAVRRGQELIGMASADGGRGFSPTLPGLTDGTAWQVMRGGLADD